MFGWLISIINVITYNIPLGKYENMLKSSIKRFFHWGPLITIGKNTNWWSTQLEISCDYSNFLQALQTIVFNILSFQWMNVLKFFFFWLGIIKCITLTTLYVNSMWWPSSTSIAAVLHETVFLIFSSLSAFSYMMSIMCGPGFLPLDWKPAVCICIDISLHFKFLFFFHRYLHSLFISIYFTENRI